MTELQVETGTVFQNENRPFAELPKVYWRKDRSAGSFETPDPGR